MEYIYGSTSDTARRNRTITILVLVGLIFLWLLYWLFTHSFISISPAESDSKEVTYTITDQSSGDSSLIRTTGSVKKLVKKGSYEILATQGENSYYLVAKTKPFLQTTGVTTTLVPEKYREFVGNNPNYCMHYGDGLLLTYTCSSEGNLTAHLPATTSTPTTTYSESNSPSIPLIGLLTLNGKNKAVIGSGWQEQETPVLADIDSSLVPTNIINLGGKVAGKADGVLPYKDGFVLFDKGLQLVEYYSPPFSHKPETIKALKPSEDRSRPVGLSASGSGIGALFNDLSDEDAHVEKSESTDKAVQSGYSEFIVYGDRAKSYSFSKLYTSGGLCGEQILCLVNGKQMDIYDIAGGKAKLVSSMFGVQKVFQVGDTIVVAKGDEVLGLNKDLVSGSILYSFGGNNYCGLDKTSDGFVVCTINKYGDRTALHVVLTSENTTNIDRRVLQLLRIPEVDTVSAYKNYIYVSPRLGDLTYMPSINGYGYDPAMVKSTAEAINKKVRDLNLSGLGFTVINPYQP